jgi:phage anti-repressor protein
MADYMGHTVKEHTNTYQKWMDKDINLEIYKEVVLEEQTTQGDLRTEITRLRAEVETLKAENESLRSLLVSYQLGASLNPS